MWFVPCKWRLEHSDINVRFSQCLKHPSHITSTLEGILIEQRIFLRNANFSVRIRCDPSLNQTSLRYLHLLKRRLHRFSTLEGILIEQIPH